MVIEYSKTIIFVYKKMILIGSSLKIVRGFNDEAGKVGFHIAAKFFQKKKWKFPPHFYNFLKKMQNNAKIMQK